MRVLDVLLPPRCAGCGGSEGPVCRACRASWRAAADGRDRFVLADGGAIVGSELSLALAAFAYEGSLRHVLGALKYEDARRVVGPIADAVAPSLRRLLAIAGPATLAPVPIHRERLARRGYNQAELIAEELGARCGLPTHRLLARPRATEKMHRLDRAGRLRNLVGAFAVVQAPAPVVIVVDDIITTSATLEACATVLRGAGALEVYGFAVAREL